MGNFRDLDAKLLKSGEFSDCQVKCDGKTWNCHKSILCMRSDYFRSSLGKDWPGGKTGVVEITDFTAEQMDWIISYIYTGEFNFDSAQKTNTILNTAVQLWTLGDYFLVPNLCFCVESKLDELKGRTNAFVPCPQDWLKVGRLIYTDYNEVDKIHILKVKFLELTLENPYTRKHNLQMPEFKTLCKERPNFGNDCMMKLVGDCIQRL
ncbi:putative btb poz domain-containing protein, partial [Colletotrichum scovillei]